MPTIEVPAGRLAQVERLLNLSEAQAESLTYLANFDPERLRALRDLADSQLALEHIMASDTAKPQDECRAAREARRCGEVIPVCKFEPDKAGFTCGTCATWIPESLGYLLRT